MSGDVAGGSAAARSAAARAVVSEREIGSGRGWPVSEARGSGRAVNAPSKARGSGRPVDPDARLSVRDEGADPTDFMGLLLLLAGIGVPAPVPEGLPGGASDAQSGARTPGDTPPAEPAAAIPSPASAGYLDPATMPLAAVAPLLPPAPLPQALVTPHAAPQVAAASPRPAASLPTPSTPANATAMRPARRDADAMPLVGVPLDGVPALDAVSPPDGARVEPQSADVVAVAPQPVITPRARAATPTPPASATGPPATSSSAEPNTDSATLAASLAGPASAVVTPAELPRPAAITEADRRRSAVERLSPVERSASADGPSAADVLRPALAPTSRDLELAIAGHDVAGGDRSGGRGADAENTDDTATGTTATGAALRADADLRAFAHVPDAARPPAAVAASSPAAESAPARALMQTPVADQVVQVARLVIAEGHTRMEVSLEPPTLGAVRVTADAAAAGGLQLTIAAEQPETRALLLSAVPEMQAALASRGVAAVVVAVAGSFDPPDGRRAPARREPEGSSRFQDTNTDRRRERPARTRRVSALDLMA